MISLLEYTPPPLQAQLSSIFGSISFSCWLILMVPQLVEQWRLKTVEGISPFFLLIWAAGDVFNLIGSIWAGLLPEVILIASWFFVADIFTLAFYLYISIMYDRKRHAKNHKKIIVDDEVLLLGEHAIHYEHEVADNANYGSTDTPITNITTNTSTTTINNDHTHHHHHHHHHNPNQSHHRRRSSTLEDVVYEPENHSIFVRFILPIILVISAGTFGSILSPNGGPSHSSNNDQVEKLGPQIFGYFSAFLYLTARLPQIYHNYKKKSTKGLSLLFFLLTMLGNITYSLQIVVYRFDSEYLWLNMSWLLGSFGTIIQDITIVTQFYLYRNKNIVQ
jgi:uncharacterized protein with PQ loop repeat